MNKTILKTALLMATALALTGPARAEILFTNSLADGSIPNPSGLEFNLNANCWFSCINANSGRVLGYVADDFTLVGASNINSVTFVGVRITRDLNVSGNVNWQIYEDTGTFDNTGEGIKSSLGALVAGGVSSFSRESTILTREGRTYYQDFSNYSFDLPDIKLESGSYFLAIHAEVSGWSGVKNDDTALYAANGYGNGRWGWRWLNIPPTSGGYPQDWDIPTDGEQSWTNPNARAPLGGLAFSVVGQSVSPIPEPETYALMLAGLAVVGAAARRRKAK
jgi:hypothetical protein